MVERDPGLGPWLGLRPGQRLDWDKDWNRDLDWDWEWFTGNAGLGQLNMLMLIRYMWLLKSGELWIQYCFRYFILYHFMIKQELSFHHNRYSSKRFCFAQNCFHSIEKTYFTISHWSIVALTRGQFKIT